MASHVEELILTAGREDTIDGALYSRNFEIWDDSTTIDVLTALAVLDGSPYGNNTKLGHVPEDGGPLIPCQRRIARVISENKVHVEVQYSTAGFGASNIADALERSVSYKQDMAFYGTDAGGFPQLDRPINPDDKGLAQGLPYLVPQAEWSWPCLVHPASQGGWGVFDSLVLHTNTDETKAPWGTLLMLGYNAVPISEHVYDIQFRFLKDFDVDHPHMGRWTVMEGDPPAPVIKYRRIYPEADFTPLWNLK